MRDCGEILHACISDEIAARFCMHEMSTLEAPFFERKFFRHAPHVGRSRQPPCRPSCALRVRFFRTTRLLTFTCTHPSEKTPPPRAPMLPQTLTCIDVHVLAEKKMIYLVDLPSEILQWEGERAGFAAGVVSIRRAYRLSVLSHRIQPSRHRRWEWSRGRVELFALRRATSNEVLHV